ncbi:MAG TPA: aminoglycoside adenylyltransferase domain-containing protein [Patescibacteria group bacterium]|nr:aminoglycoside adenylyltransferase domain-containing protein [Patescibacteria group bacterium]
MDRSQPTVEALLQELTSGIHAVLGDALVGVYVYGSYVSGGFDPGVSDVDLVVVTSVEADALDLVGLASVHDGLVGRRPEWIDRIEVVYIGQATLGSYRTSLGRLAVISPGEPFHVRDDRVAEWVQNWYLVRETGRALHGPPPAAVVPVVAWAEFVAASARYATEISRRSLDNASPGALAYAVLTMCRAHMTVRGQAHGSKQEAAAWTSQRLPEWAWLIDAALRCRLSLGSVGFDDKITRAAALTLIALLAAEIGRGSPCQGNRSRTRARPRG